MSGSVRPLTCCDRECAEVNGCSIGGIECAGCGKWFCAEDLDGDDLCYECVKESESEESEDDND